MKINTNLIAAAIVSGIVTGACGQSQNRPPGFGNLAVPVELTKVETATIKDSSIFLGMLEAQTKVTLQPEVAGRIINISAKSGQRVTRGEPIAQLRPDLDRARLDSAIANANAFRAAQEAARSRLQAAQSRETRLLAELELAQADFTRNQTLFAEGVIAKRDLEEAQRDIGVARANLREAKEEIQAARASLDQAGGAYKQAQAQVRVENENLQLRQILAPISGIVGDFPVKQGDFLNTQSIVTTITQNDFLNLRISVPVNRAGQLRLGLPVELIDPNSRQLLARGQISFISPTVNDNLQTILIKARFTNNRGILRDRQFVSAKIIWSEQPGILIPTVSVSRLGGQSFVFVATEDNQKVIQKPVKLGEIQGDSYLVIEGIQAGDNIAVTNILKLRNEVPIIPATEQSSR